MKIFKIAFGVIFLIFSYLQYNDPDAGIWIGIYGFNDTVTFRYHNEIVKGMVTGVSSAGKLQVKLADQKGIYEFGLKEIEWVWED